MLFVGKKLLVLGDSIINGSGNGDFGIGEYLAKDFGFELRKYCVGGARVGFCEGKSWLVEQLIKALDDKVDPDYIIFDGFTNDCYRTDGVNFDVPLGEIPDKAKDVYEIEKSDDFSTCFLAVVYSLKKYFSQAKILFIRPHKMGRREEVAQRDYGDRAVEICKKYGVGVADVYNGSDLDTFLPEHRDKYTFDSYGWGKGDCTHPNACGYEEKYMPIVETAIRNL